MREWRKELASGCRVGFVPTMGALHEGHATLLRQLRPRCDRLVLSIFVNPTQFGPKEDLAKYPRTFEADMQVARECGVDAVFFPEAAAMYPEGYSTYAEETSLSRPLCGRFRPGHFRGVTTVVLKLFNLVQPRIASFGLKDAQQFFVLARMARDLELDVRVEGVPTVREPDGLALSSRNRYLSPEERAKAPRLYSELRRCAALFTETSRFKADEISRILDESKASLQAQGFQTQYFDALALPGLTPLTEGQPGDTTPLLIAAAAHLGTTRLIDNIIVRPELLPLQHGIHVLISP
jgi:pantoate--beta-alanine ligase